MNRPRSAVSDDGESEAYTGERYTQLHADSFYFRQQMWLKRREQKIEKERAEREKEWNSVTKKRPPSKTVSFRIHSNDRHRDEERETNENRTTRLGINDTHYPLLSLKKVSEERTPPTKATQDYSHVKSRYQEPTLSNKSGELHTPTRREEEDGEEEEEKRIQRNRVSLSPEKVTQLVNRLHQDAARSCEKHSPTQTPPTLMTSHTLSNLLDRLYTNYVAQEGETGAGSSKKGICTKEKRHEYDHELTFTPKTNRYYSKGKFGGKGSSAEVSSRVYDYQVAGEPEEKEETEEKKINFQAFMNRQEEHEEKRRKRLEEIQQKIESERQSKSPESSVSFSPEISPRSRELARKYEPTVLGEGSGGRSIFPRQRNESSHVEQLCRALEYVPQDSADPSNRVSTHPSIMRYTDIRQVRLKSPPRKKKKPPQPSHQHKAPKESRPSVDVYPGITPYGISPIPYPRPSPPTDSDNLLDFSSFYCPPTPTEEKEATPDPSPPPRWPTPPSPPPEPATPPVSAAPPSPPPSRKEMDLPSPTPKEAAVNAFSSSLLNRAALLALAQWWVRLTTVYYTEEGAREHSGVFLHYSHFELDISVELFLDAMAIWVKEKDTLLQRSGGGLRLGVLSETYPGTVQPFWEITTTVTRPPHTATSRVAFPTKLNASVSFADFVGFFSWLQGVLVGEEP